MLQEVRTVSLTVYMFAKIVYSITERLHLFAKIVYSITERLHLFAKIVYSIPCIYIFCRNYEQYSIT
jgi:hypothetical protein